MGLKGCNGKILLFFAEEHFVISSCVSNSQQILIAAKIIQTSFEFPYVILLIAAYSYNECTYHKIAWVK